MITQHFANKNFPLLMNGFLMKKFDDCCLVMKLFRLRGSCFTASGIARGRQRYNLIFICFCFSLDLNENVELKRNENEIVLEVGNSPTGLVNCILYDVSHKSNFALQ